MQVIQKLYSCRCILTSSFIGKGMFFPGLIYSSENSLFYLTSWTRMLIVSQQVKKFPHFIEPEGLIPCLQEPQTCPYCTRWIHCTPSHFFKIHFHITLPSVPVFSFRLHLLFAVCVAHAPIHLIILDLITPIIFGWDYKSLSFSLCCFCICLLLPPHVDWNVFLDTCPGTLSFCVLPLAWETKIQTHTRQQAKSVFCIFYLYVLRDQKRRPKILDAVSSTHYPHLIGS
jgi:hypothetical protein